MNADLLNEIHTAVEANKVCRKGIPYNVALLECAANYIEKLEALVQNGQSAIDTNKRLSEKIVELQSKLEQLTQERDELDAVLMPLVGVEQSFDMIRREFVIRISFFDEMPEGTLGRIITRKLDEMKKRNGGRKCPL